MKFSRGPHLIEPLDHDRLCHPSFLVGFDNNAGRELNVWDEYLLENYHRGKFLSRRHDAKDDGEVALFMPGTIDFNAVRTLRSNGSASNNVKRYGNFIHVSNTETWDEATL